MNKSNVTFLGASLLGVALLAGCTTQGPSNLKVHEVLLYGSSQDRLAWVYGGLTGGKSSLSINGQTLELRPQISDPLAAAGSLSVGGKSVYRSKTSSLLPRSSVVQQGGTYTVAASSDIAATYLVQGGQWFKLSGAVAAGNQVQAAAQPTNGLAGAGNLSAAEAQVLGNVLGAQGTLVVTVLADGSLPNEPLKVQPSPSELLRTGLYLQPLSVVTSTTTTTGGTSVTPTTGNPSGNVVPFREVASGSNAAVPGAQVVLAGNQEQFGALWRSAYGNQTPLPPTPLLGNQSAVGIFLGSRATGGYGLSVQTVRVIGSALDITVELRSPKAGSITTQALTSPWAIVSLSGNYSSVTVRDQTGQVLSSN